MCSVYLNPCLIVEKNISNEKRMFEKHPCRLGAKFEQVAYMQ